MLGNNEYQTNLGEKVNAFIANLFSRSKVSRYGIEDKVKVSSTNLWNTTDFFPIRKLREYNRERHAIQYDNVYYRRFVVQGINACFSEVEHFIFRTEQITIKLNSKSEFEKHDYKKEFKNYLDSNSSYLDRIQNEMAMVAKCSKKIQQLNIEWMATLRAEEIDLRIIKHVDDEINKAKRALRQYKNNKVSLYIYYTSPAGNNHYEKNYTLDAKVTSELIQEHLHRVERRSVVEVRRARERSIVNNALRNEILNRDGFRCQQCGATAAEGAKLQVDHLYPIAKGGRSVKANLWTLCTACNSGKSDKINDYSHVKTPRGYEEYLRKHHGQQVRRQSSR